MTLGVLNQLPIGRFHTVSSQDLLLALGRKEDLLEKIIEKTEKDKENEVSHGIIMIQRCCFVNFIPPLNPPPLSFHKSKGLLCCIAKGWKREMIAKFQGGIAVSTAGC